LGRKTPAISWLTTEANIHDSSWQPTASDDHDEHFCSKEEVSTEVTLTPLTINQ
jgi:hypothetical protein